MKFKIVENIPEVQVIWSHEDYVMSGKKEFMEPYYDVILKKDEDILYTKLYYEDDYNYFRGYLDKTNELQILASIKLNNFDFFKNYRG